MKTILVAMTVAVAVVATPVRADNQLARSKQCFVCHNVDKELNGPAFKDVAKLYRGTPGAEAKLADKIRKGGAEHWGNKIMPSAEVRGVHISDAEAKQLAQWVLGL